LISNFYLYLLNIILNVTSVELTKLYFLLIISGVNERTLFFKSDAIVIFPSS